MAQPIPWAEVYARALRASQSKLQGAESEELLLNLLSWSLAQLLPARMVHEVTRVVLAAQRLVVKHVGAVEVRIVFAAYSPLPPMPCSSHTISQNLVPIWLSHGLLKK
jgi:hypothetical protein